MVKVYFKSGGKLLVMGGFSSDDIEESRNYVLKYITKRHMKLDSPILAVIDGGKNE